MIELKDGDPFIYMKVGVHAREDLKHIIARKREEIRNAGGAFWGYGGNTCHPLNAVQPFLRDETERGVAVHLLMQEIESHHYADQVRAESYSEDGAIWAPVPEPINVWGSRYALVIDSLDEVDLSVALSDTRVGIGRFQGSPGSEYVRGRVDKACLVYAPAGAVTQDVQRIQLKLAAKLVAPYAVMLKNPS